MWLDIKDRRAKDEESEDKKKEKKSKPAPLKKILIGVAVLIILGGSMIFFGDQVWGLVGGIFEEEEYNGTEYVVSLREFTVNLAGGRGNRFVRTEIHLAFDESELNHEIEEREPEIRTRIITFLRGKTVEDLEEPLEEEEEGGLNQLRRELTRELNQLLSSGEIKTVYFDEFVIQ